MAYTTETVTSTIRRWIVPAAKPGAPIGDINTACADACRAYREAHGLDGGAVIADDALRFHVRDDVIVIEFAIEAAS
ncbi:hypothetical protein [Streptomyces sp. NBC_01614]|uniref:hypothetical protein n=1 Tax=Streptomyces sp. NBC_01614 TaxID=2975897 RepID=UPI00386CD5E2